MRMKGRCNQYVYRLWAATAVVLVTCFLFFIVKINVSAEVIDYHRWKDFIYYGNGERDGQMTVTIRRYAGKEALLKIPKEIDGKVVTSIYGSAFRKCQNLKTIEEYAFTGCTSLKKVILPRSVSVIWENSFNGCTSLERIYIYNRNCTIKSSEYYSESTIPKDTVIYGYKGSTAEVFAKKVGMYSKHCSPSMHKGVIHCGNSRK